MTSTRLILLLEENVQNFHSFLLTSLNVQEGMHVGIPSKAVHRDIAHNCDDTDFLQLASPSSALIAG